MRHALKALVTACRSDEARTLTFGDGRKLVCPRSMYLNIAKDPHTLAPRLYWRWVGWTTVKAPCGCGVYRFGRRKGRGRGVTVNCPEHGIRAEAARRGIHLPPDPREAPR